MGHIWMNERTYLTSIYIKFIRLSFFWVVVVVVFNVPLELEHSAPFGMNWVAVASFLWQVVTTFGRIAFFCIANVLQIYNHWTLCPNDASLCWAIFHSTNSKRSTNLMANIKWKIVYKCRQMFWIRTQHHMPLRVRENLVNILWSESEIMTF